jgi:hypothetical protein
MVEGSIVGMMVIGIDLSKINVIMLGHSAGITSIQPGPVDGQ